MGFSFARTQKVLSFSSFSAKDKLLQAAAMGHETNPYSLIYFLIFCFSLLINFSLGADSLSANLTLSGDQTLVSSGQVFELGFFNPDNTSKYYVCIWYKQLAPRVVVWVANRDIPVSDKNSAILRISNGNLVLLNKSNVPIWSTNVSTSSTISDSLQAVILDSGNLVLTDASNSSSQPLWQSFDFPTNTWLPGGKIRYDKKKKRSQYLTSWKNLQDPASGLFSLELDPQGSRSYLILWNKTEQYWSSGPWDLNAHIFSGVPEMRLNFLYNFTFVDNEDESYFTYNLYNSTIVSRFVMDISGQIKMFSWLSDSQKWNLFWSQPRQQCDVYAYCGAFGSCNDKSQTPCSCLQGFKPKSDNDWRLQDYSGGCERKSGLQCGNVSLANAAKDKFLLQPNMRLGDHQETVGAGSSAECESICLNNCSCTAYTYDSNGCSIWIGDVLSLQQLSGDDSSGKNIYIRLAASEFSSTKNNKGIIAGIIVGSVAFVVMVLAVLLLIILKKRRVRTGKEVGGSLMAFGYRDMQNATKNFSEKLGEGGFGSVFKGLLSDSTVIAVKKLESINQGEKQFRTEVCIIGTIQHVNLIRLRGFCSEGSKKLLVYDYMPNGSLDTKLFGEENSKKLAWKTRYQIALGTARGLTYLHEKCRDCIVHCDIKPENVLLDSDYCPKIADFGLAKLIGRDFSRVLTTMRGTRGYLAPEWLSGMAITAKADVYSYGMMMFELVSGRRNSEPSADDKVKFFPTYAANIILEGGDVLTLLDPSLEGTADIQELSRLCKVACWCVQDDEAHRPTMGQVAQILEGILDVHLPPMPRSLQLFVDDQNQVIFFTDSSTDQSSRSQSQTSSSQAKSNLSSASTQS